MICGVPNNKIRLGRDFIKRMYKFVFYLVEFYDEAVSKADITSYEQIICKIRDSVTLFYKNDDVEWDRIQSKQLKINDELKSYTYVDFVFFYAMHFFINHEISHVLYPDESWENEEKCDSKAFEVFIKIMSKSCKKRTMDCLEWIFAGGIFAQILIAGRTKQLVMNEDEKGSLSHPFTFDRIWNYVERFNRQKYRLVQRLNLSDKYVDNFFAYLLVAILFLYKDYKPNIAEWLTTPFETICRNALVYLHNEREIKETKTGRFFCPDELVGYIENKSGKWQFTRRKDFLDEFVFSSDYRFYYKEDLSMGAPLVFILESPHKSEFLRKGKKVFLHNKKIFARPANGCTKRRFDEFINEVLDNLCIPLDESKHPVIIINACCFRCSLGKNPKLYRDRVFKRFFESPISKFNKGVLLKRIAYLRPWILVNACTKGNDDNYELRKRVDDVLNAERVPFCKCCHPSSWRKECNRHPRE